MESTSFMIIFIYESAFLLNRMITFGFLCISVILTGLATQEFGDTNVPSYAGISNFWRNLTDRCQGCEVRTVCHVLLFFDFYVVYVHTYLSSLLHCFRWFQFSWFTVLRWKIAYYSNKVKFDVCDLWYWRWNDLNW